jgi:DNA-binding PadR family transcriptional regulator
VWRYLKEKLGGIWKLGRSNVYALLSQLERDGLVYHERVEQSNLPSRKVFYLTAEGQRMIDEWMRSPVEHVRDFRLEFPAKLHFARAHSSAQASQLIRDQVALCVRKREETEAAMARSKSEIERQVLEYRIGVINGTVGWLEGLLDRG